MVCLAKALDHIKRFGLTNFAFAASVHAATALEA